MMNPETNDLFARYCAIDHDVINPEEDGEAFESVVTLQTELFAALNLPSTHHNLMRLYAWAATGGDLPGYLEDVDLPLPPEITAHPAALRAAIMECAVRRDIDLDEPASRAMLGCAMLGYTTHTFNHDVFEAWWSGPMSFEDFIESLTNDGHLLDAAGRVRLWAEALLVRALDATDLVLALNASAEPMVTGLTQLWLMPPLAGQSEADAAENVYRIVACHLGFRRVARLSWPDETGPNSIGAVLMLRDGLGDNVALHLVRGAQAIGQTRTRLALPEDPQDYVADQRAALAEAIDGWLPELHFEGESPLQVDAASGFDSLQWTLEAALSQATPVLPEGPDQKWARAQRGLVLGDPEPAILWCESAAAPATQVGEFHGQICELLGGIGDPEVRLQAWARVARVAPSNLWIGKDYAVALVEAGCEEDGFMLLQTLLTQIQRDISIAAPSCLEALAGLRDALIIERARLFVDCGQAMRGYQSVRGLLRDGPYWREAEVVVERAAEELGLPLAEILTPLLSEGLGTPGMLARAGWLLLDCGADDDALGVFVTNAITAVPPHALGAATADALPTTTAQEGFLSRGGFPDFIRQLWLDPEDPAHADAIDAVFHRNAMLALILEAMEAPVPALPPKELVTEALDDAGVILPRWSREMLVDWAVSLIQSAPEPRVRALQEPQLVGNDTTPRRFLIWTCIAQTVRKTLVLATIAARLVEDNDARERVRRLLAANKLDAAPSPFDVIVYRSSVDHERLHVDALDDIDFATWNKLEPFHAIDVIHHDGPMTDALAASIRKGLTATGFAIGYTDHTEQQLHLEVQHDPEGASQ